MPILDFDIYRLNIYIMRYVELMYDGKPYTNEKKINQILKEKEFYWLIDSEIENVKFEIKKDTIIWYDGNFYSGNWFYGIFKKGNFYGTWHSGIWESGNFDGKWVDGIRL